MLELDASGNCDFVDYSAFAASRGLKGEWDLKTTKHSLQTDSVSCGIHTLAVSYQE